MFVFFLLYLAPLAPHYCLSDPVLGCFSKCDNASQQGFDNENQKVFPEKMFSGKECVPFEAWALWRMESCFLYFGKWEWAHLSYYFCTLKKWMLLPVPDPASSRMDVHGDSGIFLLFRYECFHKKTLSVVVSLR